MFEYNVPGNADSVSPQVKAAWNKVLHDAYRLRRASSASNYFTLDPADLPQPLLSDVPWDAHPLEIFSCLREEGVGREEEARKRAKQLADWGLKGHRLHTDYCEYRIICKNGCPKRVEVTTELREYWVTVAKHDPDQLWTMVQQILPADERDELLSWQHLYGQDSPPTSEQARELQFCLYVAGNGGNPRLKYLGVPDYPVGLLPKRHILFMHHPGNGLDNLLYLIMASAQRYVKDDNGNKVDDREEIFNWLCRPDLKNRHSNIAVFGFLYEHAIQGRAITFDDQSPPGLYIENAGDSSFREKFSYNGDDVLADWIRWSRCGQRLEFGHPQAEVDLNQITVKSDDTPLTGGYQILEKLRIILPIRISDDPGEIEGSPINISQNRDRPGCESPPDSCEAIKNLHQLADSAPSPCDS